MRKYKQIGLHERIKMFELKGQGYRINKIAKSLQRSASTISREFTHNQWDQRYWPDLANGMNQIANKY